MTEPKPVPVRIRATIQYDGTAFHGSQLQPEVRTVQGEVERAVSRLADVETRIDLAGRTDAGVHALAQEIAFDAPAERTPGELERGLRALLPDDVAVVRVRTTDEGFHPRFDARARRYEYVLAGGALGRSPFLRDRAWRLPDLPPLETLRALEGDVPGERSFGGFARAGQPERGTRCDVRRAEWDAPRADVLRFSIEADRFLHHMVRYLVGTLVEIALGRRPGADLALALEDETPSRPVYPAPPGGLYLSGVRYADGWNADAPVPWL